MDEETLDMMAIIDWSSGVDAPFRPDHAGPAIGHAHPAKRLKTKSGASSSGGVLGAVADGCPPDVHTEMESLVARGVIPLTNPGQRLRNMGTGGSEYGVPAAFASARRWGYIGPNLSPPAGYIWRCQASRWMLQHRGG